MTKYIFILAFSVAFCISNINAQEGLQIGNKIPDFKAPNQQGEMISSSELLANNSGLVIIFYRGSWCPYCSKHLSHLQDSLQYISQKGFQLVVISPEQSAFAKDLLDEDQSTFPILQDADYSIMKAFDVFFTISKETVPRAYTYVEKKTAKSNGNEDGALPIPATFIVNKQGKIIWRHFDRDYRNRSAVSTILNAIN